MSAKLLIGGIVLGSFLSISFFTHALTITDATTVGVSALVGTLPDPQTDSSGGGGGTETCGVRFSGFAYPHASITVQRGTTYVDTITADEAGMFTTTLKEQYAGMQLFTLVAIDTEGRRSTILNFPTMLYTGRITDIQGIRFAPTIATDKLAMKQGDYLTIRGAALPIPVLLTIAGVEKTSITLTPDIQGHYSSTIPLRVAAGDYTLRAQYEDDARMSKLVRLIVGTTTIYQSEATENIPGDYNLDQRVTLSDFSVLAYWYGRSGIPKTIDLNNDGSITLVDFSILAFYWNG